MTARVTALLALVLVLASPARGADGPLATAHALFAAGDYIEAADIAESADSAEGLALAARALLAMAAQLDDVPEGKELLDRALGVTKAALEKNPYHVESILQRVIALGYRSRIMGNWPAHNAGLGYETEKLIDRAIAMNPDEPWAWVVRGGWEAEVLDGGGVLSTLFYDVSEDAAIEAFDRALAAAPDNLVFRVEYARALLRLSAGDHAGAAKEQLEVAGKLTATDAFEIYVQGQGRALLDAIKTGDTGQMRRALRATDPFR